MSFIENNMMPGEKLLYKAEVHWFIFIEAFLWLFIALFLFVFTKYYLGATTIMPILLSGVVILISAKSFLKSFIHKHFTEMGITDSRIIAKFGFIRRDVIELPLTKVESVVVDQSIMERIMGSGSVAVRGTGAAMAPVRFIDKPIEFRNKLNEAITHAKSQENN